MIQNCRRDEIFIVLDQRYSFYARVFHHFLVLCFSGWPVNHNFTSKAIKHEVEQKNKNNIKTLNRHTQSIMGKDQSWVCENKSIYLDAYGSSWWKKLFQSLIANNHGFPTQNFTWKRF